MEPAAWIGSGMGRSLWLRVASAGVPVPLAGAAVSGAADRAFHSPDDPAGVLRSPFMPLRAVRGLRAGAGADTSVGASELRWCLVLEPGRQEPLPGVADAGDEGLVVDTQEVSGILVVAPGGERGQALLLGVRERGQDLGKREALHDPGLVPGLDEPPPVLGEPRGRVEFVSPVSLGDAAHPVALADLGV